MTTVKDAELDQIIEIAIPFRAKDCPVERRRKEYSRIETKKRLLKYISEL
jgi:hypothetical protein